MRRILSGLAAAFVLLMLGFPASAADDPAAKGAALLASAKAASGGSAWDALAGWHEAGTAFLGGAQGTYDTWVDLHRFGMANRHTLNGSTQARGFDGATAWASGGSGPPRASQSPATLALARHGAYTSAWGFFFPDRFPAQRIFIGEATDGGVDFDIVQVTPEGGLPTELWIDRKTHLVTRMVDRTGQKTAVAVMSDFRAQAGVLTPFVVQESNGDQAHTLELHIGTLDFSRVDPSRFAPPRP